MAFPLAIYVPVRRGIIPQVVVKVFHLVFKLSRKPVADTGLIHFSRVVLVPKSDNNKKPNSLFKKIEGAMLVTSFDGGMMPYFLAFWENKQIRKIFNILKFFAVDPPPKKTGDEYVDYDNFETWLAEHNVIAEAYYNAYPQTLLQIWEAFPEQKARYNPTAED